MFLPLQLASYLFFCLRRCYSIALAKQNISEDSSVKPKNQPEVQKSYLCVISRKLLRNHHACASLPTEVIKTNMDTQKAQIVDRVKQANNILVTVSANPSVDQLAAAIGTTLLLNKLGKHATAVFSGEVPSIIEFLEPQKTIESNTDSLRDFIISLDKNKADKLRYKVEDNHVRIFITPYRTSISDKDLIFSQGDFNVEVVLALGITKQQDVDKAVAAHGRILHDATVIDISTSQVSGMGSLNMINPKASSLCEMMVDIGVALKPDVLDMQMATAFLTGIVAQTSRFSNEKTTAITMEMSSKLLAAGANQQLVATKLQPPKPPTPPPEPPQPSIPLPPSPSTKQIEATKDGKLAVVPAPTDPSAELPTPEPVKPEPNKVAPDGSLTIDHSQQIDLDSYELTPEEEQNRLDQIHIDDQGRLKTVEETEGKEGEKSTGQRTDDQKPPEAPTGPSADDSNATNDDGLPPIQDSEPSSMGRGKVIEPPSAGGTLTASGKDNELEQAVNPMSEEKKGVLLSHDSCPAVPDDSSSDDGTETGGRTLEDIERSISSPHVAVPDTSTSSAPPVSLSVDEARATVDTLTSVAPSQPLPSIESLSTQPAAPASTAEPAAATPPEETKAMDPTAPPPVPPPMMPPSYTPTQ